LIKVRDKWFRILTILLPFVLVVYANGVCLRPDRSRLLRTLISLTCIVLVCEGSRFLTYNSRRWKKKWLRPPMRIWVVIAVGLAYTTTILALSTILRFFIFSGGISITFKMGSQVKFNNNDLSIGLWSYSFLNAFFIFFFLFIGYEILYHYAKMRYTEKEKEKLEKEKLRAELNQLKGIVNPHFLFNNLNSLSSLIGEDPAQAEAFLDELTKVFRYLLRNNQAELATLGQELQFIQSYYHLLQTRYGSGINMVVHLEKKYEDWRLPPLTLQLLVENAVKHNRLQKEHPLQIELLAASGNTLMVRNTICKRESIVESTGIGLQNINARYKMLNLPEIKIEKDNHHFTVIVPLTEPQADGEHVPEPQVLPTTS
jgi:two-component system, LytTR family, sensor kinase